MILMLGGNAHPKKNVFFFKSVHKRPSYAVISTYIKDTEAMTASFLRVN